PKSLEGYYQETGRAGRDGQPSSAFMTYGLSDVVTLRRLLASGGGDETFKRAVQQKLDALLGFCETAGCRRQTLLAYFGEELTEPCGNCDTCLTPVDTYDGTVLAQKVLSTVYRTGQRFGAGHLCDVLTGKETTRVKQLGHDRLTTFAVGKELNQDSWRRVFRQLTAGGYLVSDGEGHGSLKLSGASAGVLRGESSVRLRRDPAPATVAANGTGKGRSSRKRNGARRAKERPQGAAGELFEELRAVRTGLARDQGVPPYVIFHDATLQEMVERLPGSSAELARISGVGGKKLERYGEAFLAPIRVHIGETQSSTKSALVGKTANEGVGEGADIRAAEPAEVESDDNDC
ncbi:MAG: RQC domain-containing protein, partial [Trueperaceae bacterium]